MKIGCVGRWITIGLGLLLAACGGGGGAGTTPNTTLPGQSVVVTHSITLSLTDAQGKPVASTLAQV